VVGLFRWLGQREERKELLFRCWKMAMGKRVPLWFWELGKKKGTWGRFVGWDLKMRGNGGNSEGWFGKGIGLSSAAAVFFCRDN
jgi:hypothetical protein